MDDEYGIKLTLETSSFNKQVEKIKRQAKSIQKAFDPNDISGMTIKVNGKLYREIEGISKQFNKLSGKKVDLEKAYGLNTFNEKMKQVAKNATRLRSETEDSWQEISSSKAYEFDNQSMQNYVNNFYNAKEAARQTKEEVKKVNNETKKIGNPKSFNNLTKGLDKMTSKIKRFGLSLLSIRSIWALVSRASSAYLAQDTALADKLQAVWARITEQC